MTAEVVQVTREQLEDRHRQIVRRIGGDLTDLRQHAEDHVLTPDERDLLIELEEVEFLLGDDA